MTLPLGSTACPSLLPAPAELRAAPGPRAYSCFWPHPPSGCPAGALTSLACRSPRSQALSVGGSGGGGGRISSTAGPPCSNEKARVHEAIHPRTQGCAHQLLSPVPAEGDSAPRAADGGSPSAGLRPPVRPPKARPASSSRGVHVPKGWQA